MALKPKKTSLSAIKKEMEELYKSESNVQERILVIVTADRLEQTYSEIEDEITNKSKYGKISRAVPLRKEAHIKGLHVVKVASVTRAKEWTDDNRSKIVSVKFDRAYTI